MKTLWLTRDQSQAYDAGERRFWRAIKPQPHPAFLARGVCGVVPQWPMQDGVRWFMADNLSELVPCPYGKPGDRIELVMRDCPGAVQATIAKIEVEQRDGRWGWVVEVGA
jgi:hypothetical protein